MDDQEVNLPATSLLIFSRNRRQLLWETIQSILKGEEVPTEDVAKYFLHLPARIVCDRTQAHNDILYIAGLVYRARQWRLRSSNTNL